MNDLHKDPVNILPPDILLCDGLLGLSFDSVSHTDNDYVCSL